MIEGLGGKADLTGDKLISVTELKEYVAVRTFDFVRKKYGATQTPDFKGELRGSATILGLPEVDFAGSRAGEEWSGNGLGIKFCWCPADSFTMGSPEYEPDRISNRLSSNEAQVRVTLSRGFWLGKYEVTQSEWERVMGSNPSHFASTGDGKEKVTGRNTSRFPVEKVSWDDAMSFCRKLTSQERSAGRLPADWEFTLPTESQWEYGCRAGTTTATAFGATLSSREANFDGNYPYDGASTGPSLERTTTVGAYKSNAWGLFDLHGNVYEWCRDSYADKLPGGRDPFVDDAGSSRVNRGGCWSSDGQGCRSANRDGNSPTYRSIFLGFRLATVQSR